MTEEGYEGAVAAQEKTTFETVNYMKENINQKTSATRPTLPAEKVGKI